MGNHRARKMRVLHTAYERSPTGRVYMCFCLFTRVNSETDFGKILYECYATEGNVADGASVTVKLLYRNYRSELKNAVFWDVTPCGSCKNKHFGGT
jgi:hypothetical protein